VVAAAPAESLEDTAPVDAALAEDAAFDAVPALAALSASPPPPAGGAGVAVAAALSAAAGAPPD
jgi:hypothetical protein